MLELLAKGQTHAWIVAEDKVQRITHVQVVNFEGKQQYKRAIQELEQMFYSERGA